MKKKSRNISTFNCRLSISTSMSKSYLTLNVPKADIPISQLSPQTSCLRVFPVSAHGNFTYAQGSKTGGILRPSLFLTLHMLFIRKFC